MARTSETGHAKNVANFSTALTILVEMGTLYNPTNAKINLEALSPIRTTLQNVINELDIKKPIYKNAVVAREIAIEPLNKLITQCLNYAKSLDIADGDKENLTSQVKKIRGDQKPKKINAETAESESISTSQMSYDSRITNLKTFIAQLNSYQNYNPNEQKIKISTLQNLQQNLEELSLKVNQAGNALITARKNRNTILYNGDSNVISLMKDIKAYVKSLGEEGKPYYAALVRLKFVQNS